MLTLIIPHRSYLCKGESVSYLSNYASYEYSDGDFPSYRSLSIYSVGWLVTILALILGALLQIQTGSVLIRIIAAHGTYTYEDIAILLLGKNWLIFVNIVLILGQGSVCIGVIYISASSFKGFFYELFDHPPEWISRNLCVFAIGVIIFPFAIKKEIKGIRSAAFIMISLIFFFIIALIIYFLQNFSDLRKQYPRNNFSVPFLPEKPAHELIPKITIILNAATFNQASSPVISSIKRLSYNRAIIPIIAATLSSLIVFLTIGTLGATLFGQLITQEDSLVNVLFDHSKSYITLLTQLLFSFIGIYHCPVYMFSARESLLLFFNTLFKWARKEHHPQFNQSPFPKMYDRVPRWLFYSIAMAAYTIIIVITLFMENLIDYIQILGLPLVVFLNFLFPNIAILASRGVSKEPVALVSLVIGVLAGVLPFVFGLISILK